MLPPSSRRAVAIDTAALGCWHRDAVDLLVRFVFYQLLRVVDFLHCESRGRDASRNDGKRVAMGRHSRRSAKKTDPYRLSFTLCLFYRPVTKAHSLLPLRYIGLLIGLANK